MLLKDRKKTGLCHPAVNSAVAQNGDSKPSPSPTNNEGPKGIREDKMAEAREHCMPRGENGGVGRHLVAWDNAGGAVGGADVGSCWEGPPKYTPPEAMTSHVSAPHNIVTTPTPRHVTAPPSSCGHASATAFNPAYRGQYGRAHDIRPEAYLPEAYPPLPPRPVRTRGLHSPVNALAPGGPHQPEALAKPQASSPSVAHHRRSIKSLRTYHRILHNPTPPPEACNTKTQAVPCPPAPITHAGENALSADSEEETQTPPLTRRKNRAQRHNSNYMHSASAPRSNAFSVGAEEKLHAFPASTNTIEPGTQIEVVQEIVQAQENAWRTIHQQAALAGDLDILKAFPVHIEGGRPPQWRPISYPVLKDIKKAITEHNLDSPYTISLLESFFQAFDLTPNDIRQVARSWLPVLQYSAFEAEWKALIKKHVSDGSYVPITLTNYFGFSAWLMIGLTCASLIVLRYREPHLHRPSKVFLPVPFVMVAMSFFLVLAPIVWSPNLQYVYAFLFMLGSVIVYLPFIHFKLHFAFLDKITCHLQLLLEVSPAHGSAEGKCE